MTDDDRHDVSSTAWIEDDAARENAKIVARLRVLQIQQGLRRGEAYLAETYGHLLEAKEPADALTEAVPAKQLPATPEPTVSPPSTSPEGTDAAADCESVTYMPAAWFPRDVAGRMRHAARKTKNGKPKAKPVRKQGEGRAVRYCVEDACRNWPHDMQGHPRE